MTNDAQLRDLLAELRATGSFAYDSEFIGELTYFPKLCLIQVASTSVVALIDPMARIDLTPFWELLADASVEKIVHAGDQDLEPVVRHLGKEPANVFDTQVAAGFVGLPYPISLSKLVLEFAGAKLGKGLTFSHWDQRPLSAMQLRYAADDVRYLPLVRQQLGERLSALGHAEWAAEECKVLCDAAQHVFDPESQYLKIRGASSLAPRNLAVLRALAIWRDASAQAHDLPPRAFLKDEVMLDLARGPVKSVDGLDRVRGLPRPVEHTHGAQIVNLTTTALALPPEALPVVKDMELPPAQRFKSDAFWVAAQGLCYGRSVDPAVVTSRAEMAELYRALSSGEDVTGSRVMNGWRRTALGDRLLALNQQRAASDALTD